MHRLLATQIRNSMGDKSKLEGLPPEIRRLLELVEESYHDYDDELHLLEHTLDTSSKELTTANRSLANSNDLLKSVTESIADIIFYKDTEFKYIGCNRRFSEFAGDEVKDIIGKDDYDLFDKEFADIIRSMDQEMFTSFKPHHNKAWVSYPDGRRAYLLTLRSPLIDAQGELIGLVGISHDITAEFEMAEELKTKNSMLVQQSRFAAMGEMIGNIAHQWRQPLNALGLLLQNIEVAYEYEMLDQEYIHRTIEKGTRLTSQMSQTIDDFRDFFKPNKKAERFEVHQTIQTTIDLVLQSFLHNQIEILFSGDHTLSTMGFPSEFSQVILNLLNNAKDELIEHDIKDKKVLIRLIQQDESIRIEVEDNAGGIPEDIIEKIFDPYFSTKEEGKGTGIGLYMSKTIIETNMQGKLLVENTGQGACFSIILPQ